MEDAATAEISRSQVWQWVRHAQFSKARVRDVVGEELAALRAALGDESYGAGRFDDARELFEQVALADEFVEFLTLPAYERLD
jgi:malate synthase